jgi:hypothetical protein
MGKLIRMRTDKFLTKVFQSEHESKFFASTPAKRLVRLLRMVPGETGASNPVPVWLASENGFLSRLGA